MLTKELRPTSWDQVVGNAPAVKVFRRAIEEGSIRCFLLEGSAGCGKTTLARIAAHSLGSRDIVEKNAADERGIDAWREVVSSLSLRPIAGGVKVVIIDECQGLTSEAWDCLLKPMEDPPAHVYLIFCTTKSGSELKKTVMSRMYSVVLQPPTRKDMTALLLTACQSKGVTLSNAVSQAVVASANFSFRQLLMRLEAVLALEKDAERLEYLNASEGGEGSKEMFELCRVMSKESAGRMVSSAQAILQRLSDQDAKNPESMRQIVLAYFTKMALNNSAGTDAYIRAIQVLSVFAPPLPALARNSSGIILAIDALARAL